MEQRDQYSFSPIHFVILYALNQETLGAQFKTSFAQREMPTSGCVAYESSARADRDAPHKGPHPPGPRHNHHGLEAAANVAILTYHDHAD